MNDNKKPTEPTPWRPPTRRAFAKMLGAAAVALVLRDNDRKPMPIWIGHV